jgi:hypothetical protein
MPDTGERREITSRTNAREAETVKESKDLVSKTRQKSAETDAKRKARSDEDGKKPAPKNRSL